MAVTNVNIRTDSEIKAKAQKVFASLGLDMTTAVNLFLRQTVRMNYIPFVLTTQEPQPGEIRQTSGNAVRTPFERGSMTGLPYGRGCMKGKMWMADDFDEPLEDFREYME